MQLIAAQKDVEDRTQALVMVRRALTQMGILCGDCVAFGQCQKGRGRRQCEDYQSPVIELATCRAGGSR